MFALRNLSMRSSALVRLRHQWSPTNMKKDPGITRRSSLLEPTELEGVDMDDLESDFMNVHKSHKQYIKDVEIQNERLKYLIVKRKYFKQKFPNFLTWHDKEQIKYLHSTNPEEWTIDQLSESFPALPDIIQKVINAKYSKNESKISRHDEAVQRNWQMFENGDMPDLPDSLVEHLRKFTSRSRIYKSSDHLSDKQEVVNLNEKLPKGEFSEIISSYKKLKNPENATNEKAQESRQLQISAKSTLSNDSYLTARVSSTNMVTLGTLEQKIQKRASKGGRISEEDKLILLQSEKLSNVSQKAPVVFDEMDFTAIMESKYATKSVVQKSAKDYSHLVYPEKIKIPKDKVKKGMTYKLHDCYYDSDGQFLYRVPGMY